MAFVSNVDLLPG